MDPFQRKIDFADLKGHVFRQHFVDEWYLSVSTELKHLLIKDIICNH